MSGIHAVAFLVRCTHSLLICEDIDASALTFADMGECRVKIEQIVRDSQRLVGDGFVVMGRCQYILVRPFPANPAHRRHVGG